MFWNFAVHCVSFFPQKKLYRNEDNNMDISCVKRCISRNRYLKIKRYVLVDHKSGTGDPSRKTRQAIQSKTIDGLAK